MRFMGYRDHEHVETGTMLCVRVGWSSDLVGREAEFVVYGEVLNS